MYLPAESSPLSFAFFSFFFLLFLSLSRDQVFRINVRNEDEISKLNELVNSDNFKVTGHLGYLLILVGEDLHH